MTSMNRSIAIIGLAALANLVACNKEAEDSVPVDINEAPTAEAGEDQVVTYGAVDLNASGSFDPDGDTLFYDWGFEHVPEGSAITERDAPFSRNGNAEAVSTRFVPDLPGTYVVSLRAHDGFLYSITDYVVVQVEMEDGARPVADAGSDLTVEVASVVTLDGTKSFDPTGLDLAYGWAFNSTPELSALDNSALSGADSATSSFTPDARGVYELTLIVDNGITTSLSDLVRVTVTGDDNAPVANAGADVAAEDCTYVVLDGAGSVDPDNDAIEYFWEVQSVPAGSATTNANFSDRSAVSPNLWADMAGTYVVSLTVYDGSSWSTPDMVTLELGERSYNSAPAVSVTAPATIAAGYTCCEESGYSYDCDDCDDQDWTVALDAVSIADADGDPFTYEWTVISGEAVFSSTTEIPTDISLEDVLATEPSVCDTNEYVVRLSVTDCTGEITQTDVAVNVECCGVEDGDSGSDEACDG
ncbi:MAG: hypothetical protein ACI9VR_000083 [Cognaticolwellia sp.]|jgi:hypothetical protein